MPPRPVLKVKQNRPISAIYLGKGANSNALQSAPSSSSHTEGTPPGLPDLPEPPSPSSSVGSTHSGLPSPPATNSTGSGSTGDPATVAIRERPLSHHSNSSNNSTSSGTASTPMKRSVNGSEHGVEDDDYDYDKDDNDSNNDDTARLNENVMALQRVKNLAERNRMALHKLSRISSPSPHRPSPPRSGSETERESASASSSRHHPSPSLSSVSLSHDSSEYHRPRRISAPASGSTSSSNSSHSQRRKRASMSTLQLTNFEEEEDNDGLETATGTARNRTRDKTLSERDLITQSALAAVASSRRSPLNSRRRTALPKEFRSDLADESPTPAGPSAGRRSVAGNYDTQRPSGDADIERASWKQPAEPVTPFRANRPSTLRDYRRSGGPNPRWSVDDFRSPPRPYNISHSNEDGNPKRERRQTLRGGSAESALLSPGGRSLIGEGLRAAGLSKRKEEKRVEWSPEDDERRNVLPERNRLHPPRAATSMADYRYMDKEDAPDRQHRDTDGPARQLPLTDREISLAKAEAALTRRERERDPIPVDRVGSSFSRYNHNSHAHTLPPTPIATSHHMHERISSASPFSTRRLNSQTPGGGSSTNQTEHIKLMLESLTMFETQLNKLPLGKSVGGSSSGTGALQTELARNAQSMVYAAERLTGLLKQGSGRAVEEQVEAEVEGSSGSTGRDAQEIGNIWGRVAVEYRENSRVADELVRGMTGFLLGIGRVMRDIGSSSSDYSGGSPSVHGRHASLDVADEEGRLRRDGVSPDVGSAGSGRRSVSSRHSWEPRERDRIAGAASGSTGSGGAGVGGQRPESVLARASPATYQKLRSDRELQYETPPPASQQQHFRQGSIRKSLPAPGDRAESARRLFTPREQREQMLDAKFSSGHPVDGGGMPTRDSQETVQPLPQSHEPSPTPASRTRGVQERERTRLTPLSIPKPLPTLPSEALVRRQTINSNVERITAPTPTSTPIAATTSSTTTSRDRRATIRGSLPTTPINATIALTPHTVSNASSHLSAHTGSSGSGSASAYPLLRTTSGRSERSQVTFSRPSASAALTGLQTLSANERERDREHQDREAGKEREVKRRTIGRNARMSLDGLVEQMTHDEDYRATSGAAGGTGVVDLGSSTGAGTSGGGGGGGGGGNRRWDTHAADRSAATTFLQNPGPTNRRERRRTVTDIWPQ